ncbi:hypothetical protein TNIN_323441 [Trichonephila inaurata madagascariensis]|uniref:Uncharacterized protein n=1 Tax=Trichonephila inaurata madagascariensis TaxID=2747483 RepID=A0A8X6YBP0_9ARAC|nr:hypothetical protein TNIN_323441 [Trichonephila inaurata madagascariensis]
MPSSKTFCSETPRALTSFRLEDPKTPTQIFWFVTVHPRKGEEMFVNNRLLLSDTELSVYGGGEDIGSVEQNFTQKEGGQKSLILCVRVAIV